VKPEENGECNLRRVLDQEVNVVGFEVRFNQRALEVAADLTPALSESFKDPSRDDLAAVLRDEDQVSVEVVDNVPTRAKVA
jgi:hypothetical protein